MAVGARYAEDPRPLWRRVVRLVLGLELCAVGIWLSLVANLGLSPWDVLHQGLSDRVGLGFGTVTTGLGLLMIAVLLWLRVHVGLGTVANMLLIGMSLNVLIATAPPAELQSLPLLADMALLAGGVITLGVGVVVYLGANFGSGPRDTLMVAIHERWGVSIGVGRIVTEALALLFGVCLGGTAGAGTLAFVVGLGPAIDVATKLIPGVIRPLRTPR